MQQTAGAIGGAASSLIRVPTEVSFICFCPWHIQMLLKFKLDFTGFRWLSKECKLVNSRLRLMLFALLLLKKESRVFMLYVSFNHMTIFFVPHFVEY